MSSACSGVDDHELENRSILELVSILRTAFRTADFDKVEEVLVTREVKMKKEIENKDKEFESLQNKNAYLRLDNFTLEAKLEQLNIESKEFEKWRETSENLKKKEGEIQDLKQLIFNVNEDRKAAYEKEKKALARYEKLLEDVKKTPQDDKKTIDELNSRNSELERAKRAAELDVEHWKKKYEELEHRVSRLEAYCAMRKNGDVVALNKIGSESGACSAGSRELVGKKGAVNERIENQKGGGNSASRCILVLSDSDDDHASVENLSGPGAHGRVKRRRYSCLDDSEDHNSERDGEEMIILPDESKAKDSLKKEVGAMLETVRNNSPKSRLSSGTYDTKKVVTPSKSAAVTLKQCGEKVETESKLHSEFKSTSRGMENSSKTRSVSLKSDDLIHFKPKCEGKRYNKKWESEAEMLAAFKENDELCMEAVCILYRQSKLMSSSRLRGFESDVLRGKTLALFLLDNDPYGKRKKSALELIKFDIRGVSDCRRIAVEHSSQMYEIYKQRGSILF